MGEKIRGLRDGTGPWKGSYRKITEGKTIGRRIEAGKKCPKATVKVKKIWGVK